jgi:TadE-like protein
MLMDLLRNKRGSAAAEMALTAPLLLIIMLGSTELGNYFMNEHSLVKAVRDGARFAARQNFIWYPNCTGQPDTTNVVTPTKNVVMYGYLSGTRVLTPNISASDISVTTQCFTGTVGGQTMTGLYKSQTNGAQIVTVSARVNYQPILATTFGFSGFNTHLNATSQAAVTGL